MDTCSLIREVVCDRFTQGVGAVRGTLCSAGIDTEGGKLSSREVQNCTERIQEMVLFRLNSSVAGKLVSSVNILRDSYTGEGLDVFV